MTDFIKDIYYGKTKAQNQDFSEIPEIFEEWEKIEINTDILTDSLSDDTKDYFEDLSMAWDVVNHKTNLRSFINGFRMGAKFAYEAFAPANAPAINIQKQLNTN